MVARNPNHKPAGTPEGGQFTSKGDGNAVVNDVIRKGAKAHYLSSEYDLMMSTAKKMVGLKNPDQAAKDAYTYVAGRGAQHLRINGALRSGKEPPEMHGLDVFTSIGDNTHDVLYRGIDDDVFAGLKVGQTFTDKGFMSTSISKTKAKLFGDYMLIIQGMHGIGTQAPMYLMNKEILLPRNMSYEVVSISGKVVTIKVKRKPI
jgi:hypothetical protein